MRSFFLCIAFALLSFNFNVADFVVLGNNINTEIIKKSDKLDKSEFTIRNEFNQDLELVWTLKSNSLVEGWDYSVCAFGQCSIGVPDKGKFKTIKPGEEGFFALHLFPNEVLGEGKLEIEVFEKTKPSLKAILTFDISLIVD